MPKIWQPREDEPIRLVFTKTGKPRYRVRLDAGRHPKTGKRRQVWSTHDTITAAREYFQAHKTDRNRGQLVTLDRRNRQSFAELAEAWVTGRERGTITSTKTARLRPNSAAGYRSALRRADAVFGGKPVAEVSEQDIETMLAKIADSGRTRRSAAFTLFVVRAVLKHAVARKIVARSVAETEGIGAAGADSKPREALTALEVTKLRAYLASDRERRLADAALRAINGERDEMDKRRRDHFGVDGLYACWLLTIYGLRRSEVLGLRWSDVDLKTKTLRIERGRVDVNGGKVIEGKPKTERGARALPLPADVLIALRAMREQQLADFGADQVRTGYLAVDKIGEPIRPEVWTDQWRRHCVAAGVRAVTLHAARHSSVTAMRDRGVADHIVAAWHGHDEVTMRRTYSHAHPDELAAAGEALSEAYGGSL